jgi:repressor LexA
MTTAKEQETFAFIQQFYQKHNYAPTAAEIADGIGIRSRGVVYRYLKSLEDAGQLELIPGKRRNIRLNTHNDNFWVLPLAGRIAAGEPIEAIDTYESIDLRHTLAGKQCFLLQVKGDSMINEGIYDSDYVLCEQRNQARNGEIVVALVDNSEATLKRFYNNDDGTVTLVPANQAYSPMLYETERVIIQGIYKGLFRLDAT